MVRKQRLITNWCALTLKLKKSAILVHLFNDCYNNAWSIVADSSKILGNSASFCFFILRLCNWCKMQYTRAYKKAKYQTSLIATSGNCMEKNLLPIVVALCQKHLKPLTRIWIYLHVHITIPINCFTGNGSLLQCSEQTLN